MFGGVVGIYTPGGVKGVSEDQDDAPMTEEQTRERIRQHNKEAVPAQALAGADDTGAKSSDDDDSSDDNGSSSDEVPESDSDEGPKDLRKPKGEVRTPRKSTSGLQQLGSSSASKKKEDSPAAPAISCEVRTKMKESTDSITSQLDQYANGMFDSARGRPLQELHRKWVEVMATAKKQLKVEGVFDEKKALQLGLQQLEASMSLMKAAVKASATYLETASHYDTLKLAGGRASEGNARILLDRNVDTKLLNGEVSIVIDHMTKHSGHSHTAHELLPEAKIPLAQMSIATKVAGTVFKPKLLGTLEAAQREAADTIVSLKQHVSFNDFSPELKMQIEVMFTYLVPCNDKFRICKAIEYASNFPVPDARKPPESPFQAFLLSRVGKHAVKNLAAEASKVAKVNTVSKELTQMGETLNDFVAQEAFTLRQLQLEAMPIGRKLKFSCKEADPDVVQGVLKSARTLLVTFGSKLCQNVEQSAPFLFEPDAKFGAMADVADTAAVKQHLDELKEFGRLWHEFHTDIAPVCFAAVPAAANAPWASTSGTLVNNFMMYAAVAQEVAEKTLDDTPEPSLRSLGVKLVDVLMPKNWASIEVFVTTPN